MLTMSSLQCQTSCTIKPLCKQVTHGSTPPLLSHTYHITLQVLEKSNADFTYPAVVSFDAFCLYITFAFEIIFSRAYE